MFIQFFVGFALFCIVFGAAAATLFHVSGREFRDIDDAVKGGILLLLFGGSLLVGVVAAALTQ